VAAWKVTGGPPPVLATARPGLPGLNRETPLLFERVSAAGPQGHEDAPLALRAKLEF